MSARVEPRPYSKTNPEGLKLGDRVEYATTVSFQYVNRNKKDMLPRKYEGTIRGVVIGITRKATGTYKKGTYSYEEPSEAFLAVDKYHVVYECRRDIKDRRVDLVLPEHLTKVED